MKTHIQRKYWREFQATGLLWFINQTLHLFGWVIVMECESDGSVRVCYPARTTFRGFSPEVSDDGYMKVTRWMAQQGPGLLCDMHSEDVAAAEADRVGYARSEKECSDWQDATTASDDRPAAIEAATREANSQEIVDLFTRANREAREAKRNEQG